MANPPRRGRGVNPGGDGPRIRFGHVDFGHFDIGTIPGSNPYHFDIGGSGVFGRHNDDPWHEDRQFIDNNHGDNHTDSHTDDPGYPDSDYSDQGHHDKHNDQHADDPDYPDDKHSDHYDHSDNHSDYQDAPEDDRTGGRRLGEFGRAIGSIQFVINRIIGQQRETLRISERQVSGLSAQMLERLAEANKRIAELEERLAKIEAGGGAPEEPRTARKPDRRTTARSAGKSAGKTAGKRAGKTPRRTARKAGAAKPARRTRT